VSLLPFDRLEQIVRETNREKKREHTEADIHTHTSAQPHLSPEEQLLQNDSYLQWAARGNFFENFVRLETFAENSRTADGEFPDSNDS